MRAHLDDRATRDASQPIPIVVNGRRVKVPGESISYADLVKIAYGTPPPDKATDFVVTYRGGPRPNPDGILAFGESVKLKPEMIFNVTPADKS